MRKRHSIRWQLPLSYAAVALLAAVALGVLLLLILRSYYLRQELDFLHNNAQAIGSRMAPFLDADLPRAALQSQVEGYAFLTQTRLRLLDPGQRVLADSGEESGQNSTATLSLQVEVGGVSQQFSQTLAEDSPSVTYRSVIVVEDESAGSRLVTDDQVTSPSSFLSEMPVVATPFGFGLGWATGSQGPRSAQRVLWPISAPQRAAAQGAAPVGYIELSEGPAYGRAILQRVAWGWGIASLLAVMLAAAAGWWISRRLSQPLLSLTAVTLRMVQGDLAARAVISRKDELGTLAAAFNEMARRVEETVLSLRRFVSDAAHTLRTPLTALHSDLDLIHAALAEPAHPEAALLEAERQAVQIERIERARSQVVRLEGISNGLLELSRLEARGGERRLLSFRQLVHEASEPFASRAEQGGLGFSLETGPAEIAVRGDEAQLRHAIENLLENALKFNRPGGSIEVRLRAEGDWTTLSIQDTGIGIPPEDLPRLYERFFRGRNTGDLPGSGLGLAIVKAVVEGHGGSVALQSGPAGTLAHLRLPLAKH